MELDPIGKTMYQWASDLFPIARSITGDGVRSTLRYFKNILPDLKIYSIPSGTQAFDWTVPNEWNVRDAYIANADGLKIVDFKQNNLHLVGYSVSINDWLTKEELDKHLYSLPDQPDAIPYVTSYYEPRWGFCMKHSQRIALPEGNYKVVIDANISPGVLNYGELIIPSTEQNTSEILLSTYICHPSMANNELSGPVVATKLAEWISNLQKRRYNYRIIYIPETIGSLVYLSRNLNDLKKRVVAGFNISCVGDNRAYSFLPSRDGNTLSDRIALHVLEHISQNFKRYTWADRGSDERQFCAPGIDLPIASIMRTKYGEYPEYHTSLDNLEKVVSPEGLTGGYTALERSIEALENNCIPKINVLGEPQMGKRGLYPTLSMKDNNPSISLMMDLITWSDGKNTLLEIANKCNCPIWELYPILLELSKAELITIEY